MSICIEKRDSILIVTIDRPTRRNAVDRETAQALYDAFNAFDRNEELSVAILTGAEGTFCAGADLQAISDEAGNVMREEGDLAPMGPSRLRLSKPVIAAVEGYAVAGGLELALWADMRVAGKSTVFGVFCRRFGVPLVDLGTVRLPRLVGQSFAVDMILTGREVGAEEALRMGLANRVVADGTALEAALALAREIAAFPQACMRSDRLSMMEQWDLPYDEAVKNELRRGLEVIQSGETVAGATAFRDGKGRHGKF